MAYRFLLEVPESLVEDANVVVNHVGDAQVLISHASHGLGIDEGAQDLTIAAHSLRVIQAVYKWKSDIDRTTPLSRNRVRIALHSGERLTVGEIPYGQMVAAIRRDQPWVERTIPKIGEHQTRTGPQGGNYEPAASPLPRESQVAVQEHHERWPKELSDDSAPELADINIIAVDDNQPHPVLTVEGIRFIELGVHDLAKPEFDYGEIFGLRMIGRGDHTERGWEFIEPGYDVEQEAQFGDEPEYAFLRNGPLAVALKRLGRGYPLDHYTKIPEPMHLLMDTQSLNRIRALVLMRGWDIRDVRPDSFLFRDPFGYTWGLVGHDSGETVR
jgi:hypothetical protein